MEYSYNIVREVVSSSEFKKDVVLCITNLYLTQPDLDYSALGECRIFLNEPIALAEMLKNLAEQDIHLALQLAFDVVENKNQMFFQQVIENLPNEAHL